MKSSYCLATVTSENFVVGTEVVIYSFLKCNPWFDGDIVMIIDTLSESSQSRLSQLYPIKFLRRQPVAEQKIALLREKVPELRADLHLRLLSLEILMLSSYDKVVFLDSDGLCTGDLSAMFNHPADFAAACDGFGYEDLIDPMLQDLGQAPISNPQRYGKASLKNTFNSGSMALSQSVMTKDNYEAVTDLLTDYDIWQEFGVKGFTDQMLLNIHFQGKTERLNGCYNFMPYMESYIECVDNVTVLDAKFVHFAGRIKPWFKFDWQELLKQAPHYIKYLQLWLGVYQEIKCKDNDVLKAQKILQQFEWMEQGNDGKLKQIGWYE